MQKPVTWRNERARAASLTRVLPANHPDLIDAKRNMRALHLEEYVTKVLAQAPPLNDEQRQRIAALLTPPADTAGVA